MKKIGSGSDDILRAALDLKRGSMLRLTYETTIERDFLYRDLMHQRSCIINERDVLDIYEPVIIDRKEEKRRILRHFEETLLQIGMHQERRRQRRRNPILKMTL